MRRLLIVLHVGGAAATVPYGHATQDPSGPNAGFPASTVAASNAAFPSGMQPAPLTLWPRDVNTTLEPCWKRVAREDFAAGWPGQCQGLIEKPLLTTQDACRITCENDITCPVWMFTAVGHCWQGYGVHCNQDNGFQVAGAQRLIHGDVRVLKNMMGWQVLNLFHLGTFNTGDVNTDIARCQGHCYSSIFCEYWQYGSDGCWLDAPATERNVVAFPMTSPAGAINTSQWARSMLAGEYIQHYCPPPDGLSPSSPPAISAAAPLASPSGVCNGISFPTPLGCILWHVIVLGSIFSCVMCLCLHTLFCSGDKGPTKSARKRAIKSPLDDPEVVPLSVRPSLEMEQLIPKSAPQQMTPQAAPVTYAMPRPVPAQMPTYATAAPAVPYSSPARPQASPAVPYTMSFEVPASAPTSVAQAAAAPGPPGRFKAGDRVAVWSRTSSSWQSDGVVLEVNADGWAVRYSGDKIQKTILYRDAANLKLL